MSEHVPAEQTPAEQSPAERSPAEQTPTPPPVTGHQVIDATLAELRDCSPGATGQPVDVGELSAAEQHDRLAAALDVLSSVLESSRDQAQAPIPGVR